MSEKLTVRKWFDYGGIGIFNHLRCGTKDAVATKTQIDIGRMAMRRRMMQVKTATRWCRWFALTGMVLATLRGTPAAAESFDIVSMHGTIYTTGGYISPLVTHGFNPQPEPPGIPVDF